MLSTRPWSVVKKPAMKTAANLSRRSFLKSTTGLAFTAGLLRPWQALAADASAVIVGAHPWVYAAKQPK